MTYSNFSPALLAIDYMFRRYPKIEDFPTYLNFVLRDNPPSFLVGLSQTRLSGTGQCLLVIVIDEELDKVVLLHLFHHDQLF